MMFNQTLRKGSLYAFAGITVACMRCGHGRAESKPPSRLMTRTGIPKDLPHPASGLACQGTLVKNVAELRSTIETSQPNSTIALSAGVFEISSPLIPKSGMTLCGQGAGRTIIRGALSWNPDTQLLPKTETPNAYLFVVDERHDVVLRDMSLQGPRLHGAIYGKNAERLKIAGLEIKDFLWASVRTFKMSQMEVHDNTFIDAGGRYKNTTGGAIYNHYSQECEVWNNRVYQSGKNNRNFFGFKGRGGKNCRFHHNDIRTSFAIEYPFDNNVGFEIDHNYLEGTISIPNFAGGRVLEGDTLSFHIHHNVIRKSYAIEFARNNVRINHNLFDIPPHDSGGNLISNHGQQSSPGPVWIHDNLINNVGRGVFWSKGVYNRINFVNNHVRALQKTRQSPFFQLNSRTDFNTLNFFGNIFESPPNNPRALFNVNSFSQNNVQNNRFHNISDFEQIRQTKRKQKVGLPKPLQFKAGVRREIQINQWSVRGVRF